VDSLGFCDFSHLRLHIDFFLVKIGLKPLYLCLCALYCVECGLLFRGVKIGERRKRRLGGFRAFVGTSFLGMVGGMRGIKLGYEKDVRMHSLEMRRCEWGWGRVRNADVCVEIENV
jgi:hypothetical protein